MSDRFHLRPLLRTLTFSHVAFVLALAQGSEGQKVRMRQYARQIDQALRPLLNGLDVPLILAAANPIDSMFRSLNTYPLLLEQEISGNPEGLADAELAASARTVLDDFYATQLREVHELYEQRCAEGRTLFRRGRSGPRRDLWRCPHAAGRHRRGSTGDG